MGLEYKLRALSKMNLKLFIDYAFLRESAYSNVTSGSLFYDGTPMSLLVPDIQSDTNFGLPAGSVWQSPFRQWVYESGVVRDGTIINNSPPIVASGVYIQGAFRPTNDPVFPHSIDYINGRIIFDDPIPLTSSIHSDFSYREVRFGFESEFNNQFNNGFLESKFTTNPLTSSQIVYPSGSSQPFPAIFMEHDMRDHEAYELGNRSLVIKDTINLDIFALNDFQRDNIVDILSSQARKTIPIIDFNYIPLPLSGIYNTLSPEYVPYQLLVSNPVIISSVGSGTPAKYHMFIDQVQYKKQKPYKEFERGRIIFTTSIYLIAPGSPLGHLWSAFN